MALLEDWMFSPATFAGGVAIPAALQGQPVGPGFGALDPTFDEAAMAQEAREVAAERLRRNQRRTSFGPFPGIVAPGIGMLSDIEAGGGPLPAPAATEPATMDTAAVPLPRPRPEMAPPEPTDLSAVARSPGGPMAMAPQMAPAAAARPDGWTGFWDRVPDASVLLAMAGGFAGAPSLSQGMRRGFSQAAPMLAISERTKEAKAQKNQTVQYLVKRGMSEADAKAAVANPTLLGALLKGGRTDAPSGFTWTQDGKLTFIPGGPADPAVKRAQGDRQNAPAGYVWNDPDDPSKGMSAVPGGPASKLPSEVAGRLALMHEAASTLPQAREILLKDRGPTGTGLSGAAASYTNIGETGRAQRSVRAAIEGILRALTGAAAPNAEVVRYEGIFMPSPLDAPETAKQKLDMLDGFIKRSTDLITQGRVTDLSSVPGLIHGSGGGSPLAVNQSRVINGVTIKRLD